MNARKIFKRSLVVALLLGIITAGVYTYIHRISIQNWWHGRDYKPSTEIVAIINELELTPEGLLLFNSTRPAISTGAAFRTNCAGIDHTEPGYVVGCYTSSHRMHLFAVQDERIKKIMHITAAHELLHAAWSQLPHSEQKQLATQLQNLYEQLSTENNYLKKRMQLYADLPAASFANELHSVLGTEVAKLPDWLEKHYSKWFANRAHIAKLFAEYHSVFTDLQKEAEHIEAQMRTLRDQISQARTAYESKLADYNTRVDKFNQRNQNYEFANKPEVFYKLSAQFTAQRDQLQHERAEISTQIEAYEKLRAKLQQVNAASQELNQQLDSTLSTVHD